MTDESREAEILSLREAVRDLRARLAAAEQERDKWRERSDNAHEGQVAYEQLAHDRTKERDAALAENALLQDRDRELVASLEVLQEERDAALAERNDARSERDAYMRSYDEACAMRDAALTEVEALREKNRQLRDAMVSARWRLAKGRPLWNGPCHECDAVLEKGLTGRDVRETATPRELAALDAKEKP